MKGEKSKPATRNNSVDSSKSTSSAAAKPIRREDEKGTALRRIKTLVNEKMIDMEIPEIINQFHRTGDFAKIYPEATLPSQLNDLHTANKETTQILPPSKLTGNMKMFDMEEDGKVIVVTNLPKINLSY